MTTGWRCHPVVNFFLNDNRMGVPSGSHFQIKMITGWNPSGSHNPNWKINPFSIWTMRTGCVLSSYHFDLEMRIGWHPYPVVIWKKINNRMTPLSGYHLKKNDNEMGVSSGCQFFSNDNRMEVSFVCHTRIFGVSNFFIRLQE